MEMGSRWDQGGFPATLEAAAVELGVSPLRVFLAPGGANPLGKPVSRPAGDLVVVEVVGMEAGHDRSSDREAGEGSGLVLWSDDPVTSR
jgi:hypothetical protein